MKAGREIDVLVATKVMEWKQVSPGSWGLTQPLDSRPGVEILLKETAPWTWSPSTDIWAAREVLTNLSESGEGWDWNAHGSRLGRRFAVRLWKEDSQTHTQYRAEAETLELAICLTALKACGIEVEG